MISYYWYISLIWSKCIKRKINYWPEEYNTSFQYTTKKDKTWIHHDQTEWAGVLYLTPDAPVESGTSFHRHKDTGIYYWDGTEDTDLETKNKEVTDSIHYAKRIQDALMPNENQLNRTLNTLKDKWLSFSKVLMYS